RVADQLEPDVIADPRLDRAAQAARDERLRDAPAPVALGAVRLADREPRAFDVADHSGLDDLGGAVDDAADHRAERDRAHDRPAWIERPQHPHPRTAGRA